MFGQAVTTVPSYTLYGEPHGGDLTDYLHCETIFARSRLHDWVIRPHRHLGLHQFVWVERGQVEVQSDGDSQQVNGPAAIMNPPMTIHGFRFEPSTTGLVVTVPTANLERGLPGPFAALKHLDRSVVIRPDEARPLVSDIGRVFDAISHEFQAREEGRNEALLCLAGLLAVRFLRQIRRPGSGAADGASGGGGELVHRFLVLVEARFAQQRPLSWYARELSVTPTYLSRLCRRTLGVPALAVLHQRLVLEAKRRLAYTPTTIADVSDQLGFTDPSYFTKFFVQHVRMTPSAFRRAPNG